MLRKTFVAECHCGAVRVVLSRPPQRIVDCNCSLCRRYGARWCYTQRKAIAVTARRGDVVAYRWGSRLIDFNHCRHCGCVVYWQLRRVAADGVVRVGINTRMMDPADVAGVRVRRLDGAGTWKYLD